MVPTFKQFGSKARTAHWIVTFFPFFPSRDRLIEPFAGRGNIFFRAAVELSFNRASLNDLNTAPFLRALRDYEGDYAFVDEGPLDKEVWQRWKDAPDSLERTLAESYVARFGSSYAMGPATAGGDSKNGHSRENTILRMREAQRLLRNYTVDIFQLDWETFLEQVQPGTEDIVYLDPPYDVPQSVHFDNINHDRFLEVCKALPGPTFVSGYTTPRYEKALAGWNRKTLERASVGKGDSSKGSSEPKPRVEEILWWHD